MKRNRMKHLLRVLEEVRDRERKQHKKLLNLNVWVKCKHSCATAACAAGWAGLDPWFRKNGFRTVIDDSSIHGSIKIRGINDASGTFDIAEYFGIPSYQARNLFLQNHYPRGKRTSTREVIKRVKALLES